MNEPSRWRKESPHAHRSPASASGIMCGRAKRVVWMTLFRFTSRQRSHLSRSASAALPEPPMPALLTSRWIPPLPKVVALLVGFLAF